MFTCMILHEYPKIMKPHMERIWKAGKSVHRVQGLCICHYSVGVYYIYIIFFSIFAFLCPTDAKMPVCQGGQWEYVLVLLHLLGFKLTKSLTFRGLPVSWPLLYEVKSSCVLAPCPWTQPSVLLTRQAAPKVHGNLWKCVISFFRQDSGSEPCTCPSLKFW